MIFRKSINLVLAFFLLVSNTGIIFNVHFCDDAIASITVFSNSNSYEIEKDCCGIVEKESNCCHNKQIKAEKKLDQIILKSVTVDRFCIFEIENSKFFLLKGNTFFQAFVPSKYIVNSNAPPIFERNCQRIFYA